MINAMLLRIHQSGHLANISRERFALVKEGIGLYKKIRSDIKECIPVWPTGIPTFDSQWISYGMMLEKKMYVAVWRVGSSSRNFRVSLQEYGKKVKEVKCVYPLELKCDFRWNSGNDSLSVELDVPYSARLFEIVFE